MGKVKVGPTRLLIYLLPYLAEAYLLIPCSPWTSMKKCRSSSSFEPSDCPYNLRKTRIVKCQNKKNIGKKKNENKKIVFF
jgi:hypothetical protein